MKIPSKRILQRELMRQYADENQEIVGLESIKVKPEDTFKLSLISASPEYEYAIFVGTEGILCFDDVFERDQTHIHFNDEFKETIITVLKTDGYLRLYHEFQAEGDHNWQSLGGSTSCMLVEKKGKLRIYHCNALDPNFHFQNFVFSLEKID